MSVGASIYPDHEQDAEALLIAADTALFHTKALGRGRASMFTPELLARASNKFRIEQDLRRAIERNEFELFFQPEVGIEDLQTQLVEALIRLHNAGLRVDEVPVDMRKRTSGESKLQGKKALVLVLTVIGTLVTAEIVRRRRSR